MLSAGPGRRRRVALVALGLALVATGIGWRMWREPREPTLEERLEAKLAEPWLRLADWTTDYDVARERARAEGKLILAYFTPSFFT